MSSPEEQLAVVYRDAHGVPHITASDEQTAWHALGYEQARDGLLWIQYACKAAKGELSWVAGVGGLGGGFRSDLAVKVFGAHLGGMNTTQLRNMFAPENPGIDANFFDNCVAFAAGANAYRQEVATASVPGTPEYELKSWLDSNSIPGGQGTLTWVYEHPIKAQDIVSQGGWATANHSLQVLDAAGLVNSHGPSYGDSPGTGEVETEVGDPLAPGAAERALELLRQQLMVLPGAPSAMLGSNAFCWSQLFCGEGSTGHAGLVGDPHHALPFHVPLFSFAFKVWPNHMWFAHVRVTPPGASEPSLDVFGHCPYAAATFHTSHNRFLAVGGTLGRAAVSSPRATTSSGASPASARNCS